MDEKNDLIRVWMTNCPTGSGWAGISVDSCKRILTAAEGITEKEFETLVSHLKNLEARLKNLEEKKEV